MTEPPSKRPRGPHESPDPHFFLPDLVSEPVAPLPEPMVETREISEDGDAQDTAEATDEEQTVAAAAAAAAEEPGAGCDGESAGVDDVFVERKSALAEVPVNFSSLRNYINLVVDYSGVFGDDGMLEIKNLEALFRSAVESVHSKLLATSAMMRRLRRKGVTGGDVQALMEIVRFVMTKEMERDERIVEGSNGNHLLHDPHLVPVLKIGAAGTLERVYLRGAPSTMAMAGLSKGAAETMKRNAGITFAGSGLLEVIRDLYRRQLIAVLKRLLDNHLATLSADQRPTSSAESIARIDLRGAVEVHTSRIGDWDAWVEEQKRYAPRVVKKPKKHEAVASAAAPETVEEEEAEEAEVEDAAE